MGWTSMHREPGQSDRAFFETEFPQTLTVQGEIVACATVNSVFYAAVRNHADSRVWALVVLIKRTRDYYNFTYKEMDESVGPADHGAPAAVLDALTETEHEYALAWRAKCREMLARRAAAAKVKPGDTVTFAQPLQFQNGDELSTFKFRRRSTFFSPETLGTYHITGWRDRTFTVTA